ncbi:GIY-YIG nuclease family protein [Candidatus Poriferisodalis sp.]|uniref:GIY-YIG nuclease family protein n=1 Tax=Candidatus Poriferisodalis sp. TaxID=3101277 RepID=UPI003B02C3B6
MPVADFAAQSASGNVVTVTPARIEDPKAGLRLCIGSQGQRCIVGDRMQTLDQFTKCGRGDTRRWQCRTCDNYHRRTRAKSESHDERRNNNQAVFDLLGGSYCTYERWYRLGDQPAVYYGYASDFARRDRDHRRGRVESTRTQEKNPKWKSLVVRTHFHDTEEAALQHEQHLYDTHTTRHGSDAMMLNAVRPRGAGGT